MGNQASSSSKLTNTQLAYISAVQNTINNSISAAYNSTVISAKNVQGDVKIEDLNVNQFATSVAQTQFANTNDSSILQKVSASLDNQAESLVKGIGLGNSSTSTATVNNYINSTMQLSQAITNTCSANASNVFNINVDKVGGNVNVKNISISQDSKAFLDCMTQNEQKIVATQENEATITQKSSAASTGITGFSMTGFLIFIGVLFFICGYSIMKNISNPKFIGLISGIFLIFSGLALIIQSLQTRITYSPADCVSLIDEYNTLKKQQENEKNNKFIIKPFFFTCGISGKGINCTRLFQSPVLIGAFTTTSPPISLTATGGVNNCTFAVHNLTSTKFNDINDAYTAFRLTSDCKGLDVLYSLDGRVQYIFYKEINPMCYHQLYTDLNQNITLWDGKTNWQDIPKNPLFPPLTCTVLPCIEGVPSAETRPYYIQISRNGFIYYFKNNNWVQVNQTSFWGGRMAPPLTNMLVYRGSPDKTPDLLDPKKNPLVMKDQSVAYFDINAASNNFDLYWKNKASDIATDVLQGFTKIGTIDCSVMTNDGVVAYGPNPLLKYMNRTWVKIYNSTINQDRDILTDKEIQLLQSPFTSAQEEAYFKSIQDGYNKCQDALDKFKNEKQKKLYILIGGGVMASFGFCILLLSQVQSAFSKNRQNQPQSSGFQLSASGKHAI